MSAGAFVGWAVEALIASTLLMAAVLLLRAPARRLFGPALAYGLWAIPVLRLLLPPLPGGWSLSRLVAPAIARVGEAPGFVVGVMNPKTLPPEVASHAVFSATAHTATRSFDMAVIPPTQVAGGANPVILLLGLWVAGAVIFLGYHLIRHIAFCARLQRLARRRHRLPGGRIEVIETDAAHGPLAFGIWRKYVAIPSDFAARWDAEERDLALAHEVGHHLRGDLIANWIGLFVLALHWFNPVAWRAFRAFRADQEIANDARVLAGRRSIDRAVYACAIVKAAHGGAIATACHLHTIEDLKGRLKMLTTTRTPRRRLLAGSAAVAIAAAAGLGLTASGTAAAEHVRTGVEQATGVKLASLMPATPAMSPMSAAPAVATAQSVPAPGEATLPPPPLPADPAIPVPPAPPAPVAGEHSRTVETVAQDGRVVRQQVVVDGRKLGEDIAASMPDVSEGNCPGAGEAVMTSREGQRQRIVICTNRIEAMANDAQQHAGNAAAIERNALHSALAGLTSARASITANRDMGEGARAEALAAIDESIQELNDDIAKDD